MDSNLENSNLMSCSIPEVIIGNDDDRIELSEEKLYDINPILFETKEQKLKRKEEEDILCERALKNLTKKRKKELENLTNKNLTNKRLKKVVEKKVVEKKNHRLNQQEYRKKLIDLMNQLKIKIKEHVKRHIGNNRITEIVILIICYGIISNKNIQKEIESFKLIQSISEDRFKLLREKKKDYLDKISLKLFKKKKNYSEILIELNKIFL